MDSVNAMLPSGAWPRAKNASASRRNPRLLAMLPHCQEDCLQSREANLVVLARYQDAVGSGFEALEDGLIHFLGIARIMLSIPGHIESDSWICFRFAACLHHSAFCLAINVVRRKARLVELIQGRLRLLVVAKQRVIKVERFIQRDLVQRALLQAVNVNAPDRWPLFLVYNGGVKKHR